MQDRIDVLDNDRIVIVAQTTTDALRASADHAAAIRNAGYNAAKGDMGKVASVPSYMIKAFCNLKGITWDQFMRTGEWDEEFLNSPEIAGFRTWKGTV
jgi:hypothetical protein